jgi:hypothetical protein
MPGPLAVPLAVTPGLADSRLQFYIVISTPRNLKVPLSLSLSL